MSRALVLGAAALALAACQGQEAAPAAPARASDPPADAPASAPGPSPGEAAFVAGTQGAAARLLMSSHLFVEKDVDVLTRRGGPIRAVLKDRGDRVEKGTVLCELENEDLRLALEVAEIEAEKATAAAQRAGKLHAVAAISEEALESAQFDLRSAERARDIAALELEKSYVRAPFAGFISARGAEVGQVLADDDPRPLFRVTALAPLLARIYLPQWTYGRLGKGDLVEIHTVAASGPASVGRIRWINDVLDAASGSVEILAEVVQDAERSLRPGMEVSVEIGLELPEGSLTVPREAVRVSGARSGEGEVFVESAGRVEARKVRLGFIGDDRVEVVSGLGAGERLLAPGAAPDRGR